MRKKTLCTPSLATAPSPLQEHMHTYIEAQGHLLPILAPGPFRQCALSPIGYHHLTEIKADATQPTRKWGWVER